MLNKAPKKNIIFIIADSSYVDDDITCDSAFEYCLRSNQDQVIEVDIISERTATKLKNDSHDKAVKTSLESCREYGLSNIKDKIVTALFNQNTDIVNIYTPYSLVQNDSSTHQDLSESYVSMEKEVLQTPPWDRTILFNNTKKPQDLDRIDELQDLSHHYEDFDLELSRREDSNVKKNVVEFCLKSLNAEKDDEDDEDKKKKNAVKIYIDNKPNNLLHFYSEYPDVICVFNDIKMGEEYNKHALGLAIKVANLDSKEEILKIKKTLIKAALEFEELSTGLGLQNLKKIMMNSVEREDVDLQNPIDWFQVIRNFLDKEQKQRVETKFNEAEAGREFDLITVETSPIVRADSTVLQGNMICNSSFDDTTYSKEAGILFSPSRVGYLLKKMEVESTLNRQLVFSEKNSDFSVAYENGIIKFKIKSGQKDSGEDQASPNADVNKFYYNKKPNIKDDAKKLEDDAKIPKHLQEYYTEEKEREKILELLKKASEETIKEFQGANLDKNFFIAVMKVASKERGISIIKEEEFNNCFKDALKEIDYSLTEENYNPLNGKTLHQIAKYFSAKFQSLSKNDDYYTDRTTSNGDLIEIGRRLFRVSTEENITAFQNMSKSSKMRNDDALRTSLESPGLPSPVARSPSLSPTQVSVSQSSRTSST